MIFLICCIVSCVYCCKKNRDLPRENRGQVWSVPAEQVQVNRGQVWSVPEEQVQGLPPYIEAKGEAPPYSMATKGNSPPQGLATLEGGVPYMMTNTALPYPITPATSSGEARLTKDGFPPQPNKK